MSSKHLSPAALVLCLTTLLACQGSPQVGSQTNWLEPCSSSKDCGDLECICGTCTLSCIEDDTCETRGLGTCRTADAASAIVACDGQKAPGGLCLADCTEGLCPDGGQCVGGTCLAAHAPTAHVEVDGDARHQALIGFGASLSYDERAIVEHPEREALFDVMFDESGFDVIRIRNGYEPGDDNESIDFAAQIVEAASSRLGRAPVLFLHGASPPASMKANGERFCSLRDPDCTLLRDADDAFDYGAYAAYWRESLEAFEAVDLHPDFVSIQNHPDWIPPAEGAVEACRFLPNEGTTTLTLSDGSQIEARFGGYAEAFEAVREATSDLGDYRFAVTETSAPPLTQDFAPALDPSDYAALAFNLYAIDPDDPDLEALSAVASLAESVGKPVLQTEMQEGGLGTAVLAHHALVTANASAYLQLQFVGLTSDPESTTALIAIEDGAIAPSLTFHALRHFARFTDPGWVRMGASSDSSALLSSAWLSPDESALTLVLVNPSGDAIDASVAVPEAFEEALARARVTRTVFDGLERSVDLGVLAQGVVRVPAHAAVTLALTRD